MVNSKPEQAVGVAGKKLLVVLGSGGHTTEMLYLLDSLNLPQISCRIYAVSSGDAFSAQRAAEFEKVQSSFPAGSKFVIEPVYRARQVHQPWWTTPWSILQCIRSSSLIIRDHQPELILMNGPGTAVCMILTLYLILIWGFIGHRPRTVYVESFARVRSLSMSGRLLRLIVDRFIVQWDELATLYPGVECLPLLTARPKRRSQSPAVDES